MSVRPVRPFGRLRDACVATIPLVAFAACAGADGDDGSDGVGDPAAANPVLSSSAPSDGIDTAALRAEAAERSARGLDAGLRGLAAFDDDLGALLAHVPLAGAVRDALLGDAAADGGGSIGAAFAALLGLDEPAAELARAALGLDGPAATVARYGDRIVVDPDDDAVCATGAARWVFSNDAASCREAAGRLLVALEPGAGDGGRLDYLVDDEPLLRVDYRPGAESFELDVRALNEIERASGARRGVGDAGAMLAAGRLRLTVEATEIAPGREAGSLALAVTEALHVEEADGSRFDLAPSTLLDVVADADTGSLTAAFELGALSAVSRFEDGSAGGLQVAGARARLEVEAGHGDVVVSGLDVGRGPMRLTLDAIELARVSLRPFGFRVHRDDGRLTLERGFAADVLGQHRLDGAKAEVYATLKASAGSTFESLADGVFRAVRGTLRASSRVGGGGRTEHESLVLRDGGCAASYLWLGRLPTEVPCDS